MHHIVVGTAGHVDHGKTSLVKALTGIDTDRLKEEKERGITIELGFAHFALPSGQTIGIVDVPGHERFIKQMVSGVTGIDLVLLIIAADEGVMPQTREHLHICRLLGIQRGLVVITKTDLVDPDWLELIHDDAHRFLAGTFLQDAPMVDVSAATGQGLRQLTEVLASVCSGVSDRRDLGIFRLPVDRVFTIKGFGTVITGTLISGQVAVGDLTEIAPAGITTKIRGIQIYNQPVPQAEQGQRTALNLQGIERSTIERGQVLTTPDTMMPSDLLDVKLNALSNMQKALKHRALVRFHVGTSEFMARILLLDRDELRPGGSCFAQVATEVPVVAVAGDRFVIRSYSPIVTIGGGMLLDPRPPRHKRYSEGVLQDMQAIESGDEAMQTATIMSRSGLEGITLPQLVVRTGIAEHRLRKGLVHLVQTRQAIHLNADGSHLIHGPAYRKLQERIIALLQEYHRKWPLKSGMPKEELKSLQHKQVPHRLFVSVLNRLEGDNKVIVERDHIRLPEHRVEFQQEQEDLKRKIMEIFFQGGLSPPGLKEVLLTCGRQSARARDVVEVLVREGLLIRVTEDMYIHREAMDELREDYRELLKQRERVTPTDFKEMTTLSRKYIIPLMEYFDMTKLTLRSGDHRLLREKQENR